MPGDSRDPIESLMASLEALIPDVASVTSEIDKLADAVDHHVRDLASSILEYPIASSIRESIHSSPWLYEQQEPPPPPPPPTLSQVGFFKWSTDWVSRHRTAVSVTVAFFGTGAFLLWRQRRGTQARRRARRGKNGVKTEVVILAGSAFSPLTRSLAHDLERRNFIVFIPACSDSEAQAVKDESCPDIRALDFDITSEDVSRAVQQFSDQFLSPASSPSRHPPLHLVALLLLPPLESSPAAIQSLTPSDWSDTLNVKLIAPFATVQSFLPLLRLQSSTVVFLSPSILSSLAPAGHAMDSVVMGGMQRFIESLRRETLTSKLNIVQIQMGAFDYGADAVAAAEERSPSPSQQVVRRSEIMSWDPLRRARYVREQMGLRPKESKGTSLRQLHHHVFDVIVRGKGRGGTIYVGRGSRTYDLVGQWAPRGLIGWMLRAKDQNSVVPNTKGSESGHSSDGWEDVHE